MRRTNTFRIEAPDYIGQDLPPAGKNRSAVAGALRVVDPRGTVLRVFYVASVSAGSRQPALKLISFSTAAVRREAHGSNPPMAIGGLPR